MELKDGKVRCLLCNFDFSRVGARAHCKRVHSNLEYEYVEYKYEYECNLCNRFFSKRMNFRSHLNSAHGVRGSNLVEQYGRLVDVNEFKKTEKSLENSRQRNFGVVCDDAMEIFGDQNSSESSKETENIMQVQKSNKTQLENLSKAFIEKNIKDNVKILTPRKRNKSVVCGNVLAILRDQNSPESTKETENQKQTRTSDKKQMENSYKAVIKKLIMENIKSEKRKPVVVLSKTDSKLPPQKRQRSLSPLVKINSQNQSKKNRLSKKDSSESQDEILEIKKESFTLLTPFNIHVLGAEQNPVVIGDSSEQKETSNTSNNSAQKLNPTKESLNQTQTLTSSKEHFVNEPIDTKPNFEELNKSAKRTSDQSQNLDPLPLQITFYKCILCAHKYGSTQDIERHLEIFHKISANIQKTFIEQGCFA